jgi:hypothetical protein
MSYEVYFILPVSQYYVSHEYMITTTHHIAQQNTNIKIKHRKAQLVLQ